MFKFKDTIKIIREGFYFGAIGYIGEIKSYRDGLISYKIYFGEGIVVEFSEEDIKLNDNKTMNETELKSKIDSLQRYGLHEKYGNKCIHEIPNGEYVHYDDLKKLLLQ